MRGLANSHAIAGMHLQFLEVAKLPISSLRRAVSGHSAFCLHHAGELYAPAAQQGGLGSSHRPTSPARREGRAGSPGLLGLGRMRLRFGLDG